MGGPGTTTSRFLSTLSLRRATNLQVYRAALIIIFLSTLSLRRATRFDLCGPPGHHPFLSTLSLRRATGRVPVSSAAHRNFYPRSPCGERRTGRKTPSLHGQNFYPRSPCGERLLIDLVDSPVAKISIHALLAESDHHSTDPAGGKLVFLSTLSLRRATVHFDNFNLHCVISIHALLAESDIISIVLLILPIRFLSTLSLRRATCMHAGNILSDQHFYPRSPCGERREYWVGGYGTANNFYPRSPCGERQRHPGARHTGQQFLSTLSLRRAT